MNISSPLCGVIPVLQMPFCNDESVDEKTLAAEIDWVFDCGADGVAQAMVSEVLRLDTEERMATAELICGAARDRGSVVISVGAESTVLAKRLARHAASVGATAVMAIPPLAVRLDDDALVEYYEQLITVTDLPVIVQDASGYVGQPLSLELQARLMRTFGRDRVMFKPEAIPIGPRLSALRDATHGQAHIFEGTGGLALVDAYRRGIDGTMPGADMTAVVVALWRALRTGDDRLAYALWLPLSALISMQHSLDAFLAVEKHLLVRQGVFPNQRVRGPVGFRLDPETRQEVDRLFDQLMAALAAASRKQPDGSSAA